MSAEWPAPCLIVDVTGVDDWTSVRGRPVMPLDKRPTVLQPSRSAAELEAKRLAGEHPGHRFAVFEACIVSTTVTVPSHITLGGRVVAERQVPHLIEIDGYVPF
jgi:hypothetical protein